MTRSIAPEMPRTETEAVAPGPGDDSSPGIPPSAGLFAIVRRAPGWVALGLSGSLLVSLAGARLAGGTVHWWFHPRIPPGGDANEVALYVGMAALAVAWLGLGRLASSRVARPSQLVVVAALWCLPLAVGPPLFSHDVYSYLAQGTIAHLGLSPYRDAPIVLGHLGQTHVLDAVDPFWRGATAPYGPLFLSVVSVIVSVTGSKLVLGALLVRAFELVGAALLAIFVPRLAHALGADEARAVWLVLLSPLVLLELVAAIHNDLLMIGLMVAGVTLALERRPLLGVAVCALATTIKVPAIAAVIFIVVTWARADPRWAGRLLITAQAAVVALVVIAAVTAATGLGLGWISASVFSTPSKVKLAITPATGLAWTIAKLLPGGTAAHFKTIASVLRPAMLAISALIGLALLYRSQFATLPRYLGLALIAFALGGPAAWPWYLTWGLVLLAACDRVQASVAVAAVMVLGAFLVKPNGILILPLGTAPIVVGVYILAGAVAWYTWRRRTAALGRTTRGARTGSVFAGP